MSLSPVGEVLGDSGRAENKVTNSVSAKAWGGRELGCLKHWKNLQSWPEWQEMRLEKGLEVRSYRAYLFCWKKQFEKKILGTQNMEMFKRAGMKGWGQRDRHWAGRMRYQLDKKAPWASSAMSSFPALSSWVSWAEWSWAGTRCCASTHSGGWAAFPRPTFLPSWT